MKLGPHELAQRRVELSAEYGKYSEEMEGILTEKPKLWLMIRERVKSDKAADREWDGTEMGLQEMRLRLRMKAIEKKLSAASSMIKVFEGEARNQW